MRKLTVLFCALAAAACTQTGAGMSGEDNGRDCFNANTIAGYNLVDNRTIEVQVGASRRYLLRTNFNANDLDWTQRIAVRSSTGWICTGNGLGVEVSGGDPVRHYPIVGIERVPDPAPATEGS